MQPTLDLVSSYNAAKGRIKIVKDLWLVANLAICIELWKLRNKAFFKGAEVKWVGFKSRVYQIIRDNSIRILCRICA